jgi:hypothetical protein
MRFFGGGINPHTAASTRSTARTCAIKNGTASVNGIVLIELNLKSSHKNGSQTLLK